MSAASQYLRGGPLPQSLVELAGTPDDSPEIDAQLVRITQGAADSLPAVAYASTTAVRSSAFTTVAASSELAQAVDDAQYASQDGPCLRSLRDVRSIAVPDVAATMVWPGFREAALAIGVRASLSVPLFAGSGAPVAALNLYGHDDAAMAALTARIQAVYEGGREGTDELSAGLVAAFAVRSMIQRAMGVVIERDGCTPPDAYRYLRNRASETGTALSGIANDTLRSIP